MLFLLLPISFNTRYAEEKNNKINFLVDICFAIFVSRPKTTTHIKRLSKQNRKMNHLRFSCSIQVISLSRTETLKKAIKSIKK